MSKKEAQIRSREGRGPRIVPKNTVQKLRQAGASENIIKLAQRAVRSNPA